nr:hypothetical protein CparaKRNrm3_p010 [Cryptomonas paramecium]
MTFGNYTLKSPLNLRNHLSEILQSRLNILKFFLFFFQKIFKSLRFYFECSPIRNFFFQNKKFKIKDILKKNNHTIDFYQYTKPHLDNWSLDAVYKNYSQKEIDYKKNFNQKVDNMYLNHNKLKTLFRFISKSKDKKLSNSRIFRKVFLKKKLMKKKFTGLIQLDSILYSVLLFKFHKISILYFFFYLHLRKFSCIFMDMIDLNLNIKSGILKQLCFFKKPAFLEYKIKNFYTSTNFPDLYYEIKTILYKLILYDIFGSDLLKIHMKNIQNATIYVVLNVVCYFEYMFKNIKIKILNMINLYEIFAKYDLLCKQFIPYGDFYCFFFRNKLKLFFWKKKK